MEVREVSRLLDSMCWQKVHQGDAVRVTPIDYNALMLDELEQIENFSTIFMEKQYRKVVEADY